MIILTGANGTLGRAITERLLERLPAQQLGVSVRDPEQAAALRDRGVRVRRGDFAEPATLADAFEGAAQVLIVSAGALGASAVDMNLAAISAASRSASPTGTTSTGPRHPSPPPKQSTCRPWRSSCRS